MEIQNKHIYSSICLLLLVAVILIPGVLSYLTSDEIQEGFNCPNNSILFFSELSQKWECAHLLDTPIFNVTVNSVNVTNLFTNYSVFANQSEYWGDHPSADYDLLVPYVGALGDVNIGGNSFTAMDITMGGQLTYQNAFNDLYVNNSLGTWQMYSEFIGSLAPILKIAKAGQHEFAQAVYSKTGFCIGAIGSGECVTGSWASLDTQWPLDSRGWITNVSGEAQLNESLFNFTEWNEEGLKGDGTENASFQNINITDSLKVKNNLTILDANNEFWFVNNGGILELHNNETEGTLSRYFKEGRTAIGDKGNVTINQSLCFGDTGDLSCKSSWNNVTDGIHDQDLNTTDTPSFDGAVFEEENGVVNIDIHDRDNGNPDSLIRWFMNDTEMFRAGFDSSRNQKSMVLSNTGAIGLGSVIIIRQDEPWVGLRKVPFAGLDLGAVDNSNIIVNGDGNNGPPVVIGVSPVGNAIKFEGGGATFSNADGFNTFRSLNEIRFQALVTDPLASISFGVYSDAPLFYNRFTTMFPNATQMGVNWGNELALPEYTLYDNGTFGVKENSTFESNIIQTGGNVFIDNVYGEMFNYSKTTDLLHIDIDFAGIYYNITNLTGGDCNGFIQSESGGSQLMAMYDGLYKMSFTMSFESENVGGLFGIAVSHNYDVDTHRDCYSRRTASTSVGNVGITCYMDLNKGDNVSIQVENENTNRDIEIHSLNLNLLRVGNL